ncbi:hypothetical protein K2173_021989 [Erythroxylum novogranatense]|uniref:NAC domain-containing protein n=1 Tax=Erythroxylum novogranatense TaxID=1862640 RepID=A0AAV8T3J0_9ROSI|nr:hypothetical protein K2173_021989 [Erythroxylum novogranatense]
MESCVPPGFRFHPTEEELVGYYLKRKINSLKIDLDVIIDIDLYKMEPWDIQARSKLGYENQSEWYFFSHKDRKYPTGTRTNRATAAGFWKATGRDKAVLSKNKIIGMRKTLVFYKGRAPNGRKTDWIMHEYRLQTSEYGPPQEEGWVVCRAFKKPNTNQRQGFDAWNHTYGVLNTNHVSPLSYASDAVNHVLHPNQTAIPNQSFGSDPELFSSSSLLEISNQLIELPQLDSPSTISTSFSPKEGDLKHNNAVNGYCDEERSKSSISSQFTDWKNLDSLLTSHPNDTATFNRLQNFPSLSYDIEATNHVCNFLGFSDL